MKQKFLTFGFKDEYMHMFGINNIGSIFHINKREQFAVTPKEIIKYERNQILKRYHFHFSIGCCIDTYNMAAFITENKSKLYIFSLKDMSRPLISNFSLNQAGIFHILYSPRSNCLITFGTGVRVWQLFIESPNQSAILDPTIQITLRSDFAYDRYETVILNQPSFDYQRELIILPTNQGIKGFNLDGLQSVTMTRLPAQNTTPIGYCQSTSKLLTSDPQEGICLWDKHCKIKNTYTICSSSILSINFINPEHAIVMNCHGAIFILNLKTGRSYHIYTSPMIPNRLLLQLDTSELDPILVFIFNSRCVYKRIVIPWTLWTKNVIFPKLIRRVNKINEAARILVQTGNSFVKLYSPKTAKPLTSASPQNSATTVYVLYDRGTFISSPTDSKMKILETEKRDELFISMDDGKIYGFDTGFLPCQEVLKIDLKSTLITTCFLSKSDTDKPLWMYALASPNGEVFLCDYNSFRSTCKITIGKYKPLNLFFHEKTESLVILFADEVVLISTKRRNVTARLDLSCSTITVSHLNGDRVYIGLKTGQILVVEIIDHLTLQILNDLCSNVIHSEPVSSFAFSASFWVSAGEDGSVFYWEYSLNSIAKINLPEPIYACEVINGRRDLVVGTKSELMLIKGEIVFDGEIDEEIECIDNFDRKNDQLFSEIFTITEEEDEIEESLLDQRKANKNKNKNNDKREKNVFQNKNDIELKKEEALNEMEKLNQNKNNNKIINKIENKLIEEEEMNDSSQIENVDDLQKQNKKKKKKKQEDDDDKKSDVNIDSSKNSNKEKEDFLNDLFPKKKFIPPQEPKNSPVSKRTRHEKLKKVRSSRPDRRTKPNSTESKNENEANESDQIKLVLFKENDKLVNDENKENDQTSIENENNEEKNLFIDDKAFNNHEDVGTQSEVTINEDANKKSTEQTSQSVKNTECEENKKEKNEHSKPSQNKEAKKVKQSTIKPSSSTEKTSLHHQKSHHKNEPENHITHNKTEPSISIQISNPPKKCQIIKKRPKTPPPHLNSSPRRLPHISPKPPAPTASPHKNEKSKIKTNDQKEIQKVQPIQKISPMSRLIEPRNDAQSSEKWKMQVEANTRLYVCNLPQSNRPLSIVTNLDDPSWHENGVTFCTIGQCQKSELFDKEEPNKPIQNDSSEKVGCFENSGNETFEEEEGNDRLAEAVNKRCPGLIFTQAPKPTIYSGSFVPGAAWMRKTKIGSRLIKSIHPKVFSPIGKIEKSVKIRNSSGARSNIIQTPLDRIRNKRNYAK